MTAFDAHLRPRGDDSAWRLASTIVGDRPGVTIVAIVAAALIVCLAFLALAAGQELRFRTAAAVEGLQASLFLRPQASRAAAEALKVPLEALPFVHDATLHTKEAAIVALKTVGVPQPSDRSNPLPDVWVVTLAVAQPDDAAKSLSERVSAMREALARLPDVESVDVDAPWLATLERWQRLSATGWRLGLAVGFPVVWLLLACLFYLAGRGLVDAERSGRLAASAIVGGLLGLFALVAGVALLACVAFGAQSAGIEWKPIVVRIGQMSECVLVLVFSTIVLSVVTFWAAGRHR